MAKLFYILEFCVVLFIFWEWRSSRSKGHADEKGSLANKIK